MSQRRALGAALLLVACLHLLTTQGTWIVTDQAEYLAQAQRMLEGRLILARADEPSYPGLPWTPRCPDDGIQRSRLLPFTSLSLAPLLALDHLLGLTDPVRIGRIVHLQGHIFVLAALALLGLAVRARGGSPGAVAAAVVLAGTCWPLWLVSRRSGPEPIQAALVAALLLARCLPAERARVSLGLAVAVGALLPWTNPAGSVVGIGLALGFGLEDLASGAGMKNALHRLAPLGCSLALSVAAYLVFWNWLYHGHFWGGGYVHVQGGPQDFLRTSPIWGLLDHVRGFLVDGLVIVAVAVTGCVVRRSATSLLPALGATLAMSGFFSTFYPHEPSRRLAFAWPLWAAAAGAAWDVLPLRRRERGLLLLAAALSGVALFLARDGAYLQGPDGIYYPCVLWLELAFAGRPLWQWALPVAALAGLAGFALRWLGRRPAQA
jgi:hypothetical protein